MSADLSPPANSPATGVTLPPVPHLPPLPGLPSSLPPMEESLRPGSPSRRNNLRRLVRWWPLAVIALCVVLAVWMFGRVKSSGPEVVTAPVVRGDLPVIVVERGELDSIKSIVVRCEVEGERIKLVHILPEGTHVSKGDEVAKFDTDELRKQYEQQRVKLKAAQAKAASAKGDLAVQKNKEKSEVDKGELAREIADITLDKYQQKSSRSCWTREG